MSESLIFAHFLFFGERCEWIAQVAHQKWVMWANRSGHSPKMSDHERFAQVAHQKWATMSKSLRSLTKNERMARFCVCFFAKNEWIAQKTDERTPSPEFDKDLNKALLLKWIQIQGNNTAL